MARREYEAGEDRLYRLRDLEDEYEVAEGDPDVRGWDVVDTGGRKIGEVDELIIDPEAEMVRYLDVDVEDGRAVRDDTHVLVPIGLARLDEENEYVVLERADADRVLEAPLYNGRTITRDYETSIRRVFLKDPNVVERERGYYDHDVYDPARAYRSPSGR